MVNDCPLRAFIKVNWLVPSIVTWPSTSSRFSISIPSSESCRWVTCATVTAGLMERSPCTEEFTFKSNLSPKTEFVSSVMGKGAPDNVAEDGLRLGVNWQTALMAHIPICAGEWFTIVSTGLAKVKVRLL